MKKFTALFAASLLLIVVISLSLRASHPRALLTADLAPALLVKLLPGDTASVPLGINDADIDIQVTGNIAVTTMTLNFYNDQSRNLEGQFIFPLAEGQTIHYFAMDVNGVMHEGAVVEKQKGREVFESIERRRVDPGLLEWSKGNNFSARVFPIPSKGYKKIVVAFQQELQAAGSSFIYNLPLGFKQRVKHFGIKAAVSGDAAQPLPMGDNAYMLAFAKPNVNWQAQMEYKNIIPDHAIQFQIPAETKTAPVYMEKVPGTADSYYFYALVHADAKSADKTDPKKLGIIWDVSGSAVTRDREKELDVIRQYLARLKNVQVQVTAFSATVNGKKEFNISNENSSDLLDYLRSFEPDGGTQLGCIDLSASDRDEILLFSDGVHTFGDRNIKFPKCPIYTFSTGNGADYAMLDYISRSTNGKSINASALKMEEILPQLTQTGFNFISATALGRISQVYPSFATPCGGYFGIAGKVDGKNGSLKLNFGTANTISQTIDVNLEGAQQAEKTIGRLWAQKKIAELELKSEQNKDQITALGREFSIITRYTSLIVLESIDDYVRYGIIPPDAATKKEYAERMKLSNEESKKETKTHADQVVDDFKKVVTWWTTDYKPVYRKRISDTTEYYWTPSDSTVRRRVSRGGTWHDTGYFTDSALGATYYISTDRNAYSVNPTTLESEEITNISGDNSRDMDVRLSGGRADERQSTVNEDVSRRNYREGEVRNFRGNSVATYTSTGTGNGSSDARPTVKFLEMVEKKDEETKPDGESMREIEPMKGSMNLRSWDSKEPYMAELKTAQGDMLYKKYISLKKQYKDMPSFYIDVADYFDRANRHDEAIRIISNLAEIKSDDSRLMRVLAHRLQQWNENKLAANVYEEVLKMKPEEPQSYRDLGLAYAEDKKYQKAVDMLCKVVNKKWDDRFPEIEALAACEINYLASTSEVHIDLDSLDKRLVKEMPVDIRVVIDWDADNSDIDLWVTDPAGEKCLYSNPLTRAGGRISRDFTRGYGPEEFKLKKALPGKYKVQVHYYGDGQLTLAGPTTIHAQMYTNYGKANQQRKEITLRLATQKEEIYVGDFEFSR